MDGYSERSNAQPKAPGAKDTKARELISPRMQVRTLPGVPSVDPVSPLPSPSRALHFDGHVYNKGEYELMRLLMKHYELSRGCYLEANPNHSQHDFDCWYSQEYDHVSNY